MFPLLFLLLICNWICRIVGLRCAYIFICTKAVQFFFGNKLMRKKQNKRLNYSILFHVECYYFNKRTRNWWLDKNIHAFIYFILYALWCTYPILEENGTRFAIALIVGLDSALKKYSIQFVCDCSRLRSVQFNTHVVALVKISKCKISTFLVKKSLWICIRTLNVLRRCTVNVFLFLLN